MNSREILFYIALAFSSMYIYEHFISPTKPVPSALELSAPPSLEHSLTLQSAASLFRIDSRSGDIIEALSLKHKKDINSDQPEAILSADPEHPLFVEVGIKNEAPIHFHTKAWDPHRGGILVGQRQDGVWVEKTYVLDGDYVLNIDIKVSNHGHMAQPIVFFMGYHGQGNSPWRGQAIAPDRFVASQGVTEASWLGFGKFSGVSYHDIDHSYKKFTYANLAKTPIQKTSKEPWLAVQRRYFLTALIPSWDRGYDIKASWKEGLSKEDVFHQQLTASLSSMPVDLQPGESSSQTLKVFAGPENAQLLRTVAPQLDLTVDFGFFWIFCEPLLWVLEHIDHVFHNWGWSIVAMTVLFRLALYRSVEKSFLSIQKLKKLEPKMKAIREKYGEKDPRRDPELLNLFRQEKINPLSVYLLPLIPLPIMMALYYVLLGAIELRHASFLWVSDLSTPDPWFLLSILNVLVMYAHQSLTPSDPSMRSMMFVLPLFIGITSSQIPSGLALFYFLNTLFVAIQQWWLTRKYG